MNPKTRMVVYIDVDDTLVRSAGIKIMPVPRMVEHANCSRLRARNFTAGAPREPTTPVALRKGLVLNGVLLDFFQNLMSLLMIRNPPPGSDSRSCIL